MGARTYKGSWGLKPEPWMSKVRLGGVCLARLCQAEELAAAVAVFPGDRCEWNNRMKDPLSLGVVEIIDRMSSGYWIELMEMQPAYATQHGDFDEFLDSPVKI